MDAGVVLLVFGLVFLSGSALAAFAWAVRDGQFEGLDRAAESIFDADERGGMGDGNHGGHGGHGGEARGEGLYHGGHGEHGGKGEGEKEDAGRDGRG